MRTKKDLPYPVEHLYQWLEEGEVPSLLQLHLPRTLPYKYAMPLVTAILPLVKAQGGTYQIEKTKNGDYYKFWFPQHDRPLVVLRRPQRPNFRR